MGSLRTILVTGGAGYIGSHTAVELLAAGHDVVIIDNFDNSSPAAVEAVRTISGRDVTLVEGDVGDSVVLDKVFANHPVDAVVHFAAHKAVGESVAVPLRYYRNNIAATAVLAEAMQRHGCRRLVFSSSCTVYGEPDRVPITEDFPLIAVNPYGRTKLVCEEMLRDVAAAEPDWHVSLLRYFNPVGAHPSGDLGEDPRGIPNNLMPYIMQVAVGRREMLSVFGGDYPTRDGTCIRDYIHVVDLARGHLAALDALDRHGPGCRAFNLGTGRGTTVLEMLAAASRAVGGPIPHEVVARRPGDAMEVYADPSAAQAELAWRAELDVDQMCVDHWRWQSKHPRGFVDE
ncbi:MAG: UDP-glucose 4-epimerase GalE [Acidimicrobiia bacterium]|nr:UDP-glucose 4-epimerase GalE [Acidimicrobiia bacterium]